MGVYIDVSNFRQGEYSIMLSGKQVSDLTDIITKYETIIITELLGSDLGEDFMNSTTPPGTDVIVPPFNITVGGTFYKSKGLIEMLKGFVYFYYGRQLMSMMRSDSIVKGDSENSNTLGNFNTGILQAWNDAVNTYQAIQGYIGAVKGNGSTWDTYDGQCGEYSEAILPF